MKTDQLYRTQMMMMKKASKHASLNVHYHKSQSFYYGIGISEVDLHADTLQYIIRKGGMHLAVSEKPHKMEKRNRTRRSSPGETNFDIEILFVIDHTIYE